MTREQKVECWELRRQGYTLQWLGDRYGLTRERIRQILDARELQMAGVSRKLSSCIYPEIRKWMIINCFTYGHVATRCGVTYETLRNGLTGRTTLSKKVIDAILDESGMDYETAFRL